MGYIPPPPPAMDFVEYIDVTTLDSFSRQYIAVRSARPKLSVAPSDDRSRLTRLAADTAQTLSDARRGAVLLAMLGVSVAGLIVSVIY